MVSVQDSGSDAYGGVNSVDIGATHTIAVSSVNDPAVLSGNGDSHDFYLGDSAITLFTNASATPIEASQTIERIQIELSDFTLADYHQLTLGADTLTLSGNANDLPSYASIDNTQTVDMFNGISGIYYDQTVSNETVTITQNGNPISVSGAVTFDGKDVIINADALESVIQNGNVQITINAILNGRNSPSGNRQSQAVAIDLTYRFSNSQGKIVADNYEVNGQDRGWLGPFKTLLTIEQSMTGVEATNLISGMTYQNISTAIADHTGAVRFNLYSITEQTQDGLNTVFVASGAPGDPLPSDPNNQYTDWVNASEVNLLGAITDSIVPFNVSYDAVESSQSEFGQAIQMFDNLAVTTSVLSTVGDVNSGSVTGNIGSITFLINDVADADNEFIIIGGQTVALSQTDAMLGNGIELQLGQVVPDPQTRQNDIVYQSVFDANQSTTRAITISGDWSASELNTLLSEARYVASTALVDRSFEIAEIIDAEGDYVRSFNLGDQNGFNLLFLESHLRFWMQRQSL